MADRIEIILPDGTVQEVSNEATVRFSVRGGPITVSMTGSGDIRVDGENRQSLKIDPLSSSGIVVRLL